MHVCSTFDQAVTHRAVQGHQHSRMHAVAGAAAQRNLVASAWLPAYNQNILGTATPAQA
jgi:hypothetical protein